MKNGLRIALIVIPIIVVFGAESYTGELLAAATNVYHQMHARLVHIGLMGIGLVILVPIAAMYVARVMVDESGRDSDEGKEDG